ncbi:hypothetical protein GZ77_20380 [Endozoicomonas montiporae]|uniref:Uncharacterized protein n=2 Tax=Endozoicomonas montiporae TaxID=1027273 RepID=A0A081N2Z1_9GAMM|nr:hypothetical protein [Endozoicomonas montiporae]AMO58083.1 hypothetical protein EZMO1_4158 [Endozoicomonas montiporae CL-33]KEQ12814.1 hypothetical protein GZ77_20380 [Endozoicomonas montiporae]
MDGVKQPGIITPVTEHDTRTCNEDLQTTEFARLPVRLAQGAKKQLQLQMPLPPPKLFTDLKLRTPKTPESISGSDSDSEQFDPNKAIQLPLQMPDWFSAFSEEFACLTACWKAFEQPETVREFLKGNGPLYNRLISTLIRLDMACSDDCQFDQYQQEEIVRCLNICLGNLPLPWWELPLVWNPYNTQWSSEGTEKRCLERSLDNLALQKQRTGKDCFMPPWMETKIYGQSLSDIGVVYHNFRNDRWQEGDRRCSAKAVQSNEPELYEWLSLFGDRKKTIDELNRSGLKSPEIFYETACEYLSDIDSKVNSLLHGNSKNRFRWQDVSEADIRQRPGKRAGSVTEEPAAKKQKPPQEKCSEEKQTSLAARGYSLTISGDTLTQLGYGEFYETLKAYRVNGATLAKMIMEGLWDIVHGSSGLLDEDGITVRLNASFQCVNRLIMGTYDVQKRLNKLLQDSQPGSVEAREVMNALAVCQGGIGELYRIEKIIDHLLGKHSKQDMDQSSILSNEIPAKTTRSVRTRSSMKTGDSQGIGWKPGEDHIEDAIHDPCSRLNMLSLMSGLKEQMGVLNAFFNPAADLPQTAAVKSGQVIIDVNRFSGKTDCSQYRCGDSEKKLYEMPWQKSVQLTEKTLSKLVRKYEICNIYSPDTARAELTEQLELIESSVSRLRSSLVEKGRDFSVEKQACKDLMALSGYLQDFIRVLKTNAHTEAATKVKNALKVVVKHSS